MYLPVSIVAFAWKDFFDFTKVEAKDYMKWFLGIREERIIILERNVQIEFPEWKANYLPESLIILYEWFKAQIAYRLITKEEKFEIVNQIDKTPLLSNIIPIPEVSFSIVTVSICFDIGLYFGEVTG